MLHSVQHDKNDKLLNYAIYRSFNGARTRVFIGNHVDLAIGVLAKAGYF